METDKDEHYYETPWITCPRHQEINGETDGAHQRDQNDSGTNGDDSIDCSSEKTSVLTEETQEWIELNAFESIELVDIDEDSSETVELDFLNHHDDDSLDLGEKYQSDLDSEGRVPNLDEMQRGHQSSNNSAMSESESASTIGQSDTSMTPLLDLMANSMTVILLALDENDALKSQSIEGLNLGRVPERGEIFAAFRDRLMHMYDLYGEIDAGNEAAEGDGEKWNFYDGP